MHSLPARLCVQVAARAKATSRAFVDPFVAAHPGCIRVVRIIFQIGPLMFHLSKALEGQGYPLKLHHYLERLVHWVANKHQVIGDHPDLVPISNVSTAWKAADPWGNLRLPRAASTGSDMPPPPRPPAGSRCCSRSRSLPPPPPCPPSTAPGSPASTAAPERKFTYAPWNDPQNDDRVPVTPPSPPSTAPVTPTASPPTPPPWDSLERRRTDGSVRTARAVSSQSRQEGSGQRVDEATVRVLSSAAP